MIKKNVVVQSYYANKDTYQLQIVGEEKVFYCKDSFLRKFNEVPSEQLENGKVKVGSVLKMVGSEQENGRMRYTLDNEVYMRRSTPVVKKKGMSEASLFSNVKPYVEYTLDTLKENFFKKVSKGDANSEDCFTIVELIKNGDEIMLRQKLVEVLGVFELGAQESPSREYKASFLHCPSKNDPPENMEEHFRQVCSYGNSEHGGDIFIGVDNNGKVVGVNRELLTECKHDTRERFVDAFLNRLKQLTGSFEFASSINFTWYKTEDNKVFCQISVPPFDGVVLLRSELFVRTLTGMTLLRGQNHIDYILKNAKR